MKQMYSIDLLFDEDRFPRLEKQALGPAPKVSNAKEAVRVAEEHFALSRQPEEHVYCLFLDAEGAVRAVSVTASGSNSECVFNLRGIYTRALLVGCWQMICLHNHPSGSLKPSEQDLSSYRKLIESSKVHELKILDNIIVGDGEYYSFCEQGIA